MAAIITEIYVSLDSLEYVKLDLYKDESINVKKTQKDLQDLSKIFYPYSQGFNFEANPKNRQAFGFFGDTDVIKVNPDSKFPCKIFTDGNLNETGFIQLTNLAYKNNKPTDFTGNFTTNLNDLKQRIGDDELSDLTDLQANVNWSVLGVQNMIKSKQSIVIDGVLMEYFIPLISIDRVFGYDLSDNPTLLDNIAYKATTPLDSNNLIKPTELRACVSYASIINLIKKKYALTVISPLEDREEFKDLFVWCNSERISEFDFQDLPILKSSFLFGWYDTKNITNILNYPDKYTISTNLVDNTFIVNKRASPYQREGEWVEKAFQFRVKFNAVSITGDAAAPEVVLQYVRKSDDVVFITDTFELTGNVFDCVSQVDDTVFAGSNSLEFYIRVKFNQPTSWSSCDFRIFMRFYDGKVGVFNRKEYAWFYYDNLNNNNSALISTDKVDLISSLPKIKIVDFLTSHFKSFNISVYDPDPNNEDLYWLTPEDVKTTGKVYSKSITDYTKYVDIAAHNKKRPNDFTFYNFKHADSSYFSNVKYKEAFEIEYGQLRYPEIPPEDAVVFNVETNFSILPPVQVKGATGFVTAYGFNSDDPTLLDTGETRYSPNYDELTVFYSHGSTECSTLGLFGLVPKRTSQGIISSPGVFPLTGYMKVMPFSKNGHSFGFSVLRDNGVDYLKSLFAKYYADQTARLLDPNVLSQEFMLNLPGHEIFLNESTTSQGSGNTPGGFRLQNDIIIGEDIFSIVDSTIDYTTGKTKLTLLNY